ncbi:MAG: hypothetical protein HYS55_04230 [Candidatus Omnitrophica bacterium]|nr:hypothetical protein [Candidatus Omnitrophota bacterium]
MGTYNIYLGGNLDGTRLNKLYLENVPQADIVKTLVPVFKLFKLKRKGGEEFGNFCDRIGIEQLKEVCHGTV